jgi:hypothetical protein
MDDKPFSEQADLQACALEPEQVIFPLQDGNFVVGFHYRSDPEGPLMVLLHGASDCHTVFDFAPWLPRCAHPGTTRLWGAGDGSGGLRSGQST